MGTLTRSTSTGSTGAGSAWPLSCGLAAAGAGSDASEAFVSDVAEASRKLKSSKMARSISAPFGTMGRHWGNRRRIRRVFNGCALSGNFHIRRIRHILKRHNNPPKICACLKTGNEHYAAGYKPNSITGKGWFQVIPFTMFCLWI